MRARLKVDDGFKEMHVEPDERRVLWRRAEVESLLKGGREEADSDGRDVALRLAVRARGNRNVDVQRRAQRHEGQHATAAVGIGGCGNGTTARRALVLCCPRLHVVRLLAQSSMRAPLVAGCGREYLVDEAVVNARFPRARGGTTPPCRSAGVIWEIIFHAEEEAVIAPPVLLIASSALRARFLRRV